MYVIADALTQATPKCSDLAREFNMNPASLVAAEESDFDLMLDSIVTSGKITQEALACALAKPLVGHGALARRVHGFDFSDVSK